MSMITMIPLYVEPPINLIDDAGTPYKQHLLLYFMCDHDDS